MTPSLRRLDNSTCHRELAVGQKPDSSPAAGEFDRHHHVGNQERMFQKHPARSPVLFAPTNLAPAGVKVAPEAGRAFAAKRIDHAAGTALVIIVDLGARTFQEAVMVEPFQPPQKLLLTAGDERMNMGGPNETKLLDQPDDSTVALGEPHRGDGRSAFEAGKVGSVHWPMITGLG